MTRRAAPRVLIYSHDTFGLGHLRRSRAIANALVEGWPDASVVIVSGSPVIGGFEFGGGVDYVRVPGVTKLPNGDYCSLNLNLSLDEAVSLRQALISQTAETFAPDIFIVDKEPTGFRGEILPALERLRARGCHLVLGVRDVLDDAAALAVEWDRKGAREALERFYDEVWIYGLREIYEPLKGLDLSDAVQRRLVYTGYLRRQAPQEPGLPRHLKITRGSFILVTAGGGGDGEDLIDWVVSAYEADASLTTPALIVFGPFISRERRRELMTRISRHARLDALSFDPKMEFLMQRAAGIVAMGGYNTFCEILSFDKRALIVPRVRPRLEQYIRATAAERLGLTTTLVDDASKRDPMRMALALQALTDQKKPSDSVIPGLLGGIDVMRSRFATWLETPLPQQAREVSSKVS